MKRVYSINVAGRQSDLEVKGTMVGGNLDMEFRLSVDGVEFIGDRSSYEVENGTLILRGPGESLLLMLPAGVAESIRNICWAEGGEEDA